MLKHLQKFFAGDNPVADAQASNPQEDVVMTDVTQSSGAPSAEVDVALKDVVASLTEQLTAANQKIAELTAVVDAAAEFNAAQAKLAADAKAAARMAKLVDVVGTDAAANLMAVTASMEDSAFEAVVAAMSLKASKEATDPAFKEVGVEGAADPVKLAQEAQGNRMVDYLRTVVKETKAQ